jgi:hypothetical protein
VEAFDGRDAFSVENGEIEQGKMNMSYTVQCMFETGGMVQMMFKDEISAHAARNKIADGMSGDKYQTRGVVVEISSESSTYNIRPSNVQSVSVIDTEKWNAEAIEQQNAAKLFDAEHVAVYGPSS